MTSTWLEFLMLCPSVNKIYVLFVWAILPLRLFFLYGRHITNPPYLRWQSDPLLTSFRRRFFLPPGGVIAEKTEVDNAF